tara:strand:- start:37 stop:390 length:354 start_codon:yes stop_codon:yes gene_type:complete
MKICTLKKRKDFTEAASGHFVRGQGLLIQGRNRGTPDDPTIRVGFTCSKKIGNAVNRNRAKRRLREMVRHILPDLGNEGWDYVLIGQTKLTEQIQFSDLLKEFKKALKKVHEMHENT